MSLIALIFGIAHSIKTLIDWKKNLDLIHKEHDGLAKGKKYKRLKRLKIQSDGFTKDKNPQFDGML